MNTRIRRRPRVHRHWIVAFLFTLAMTLVTHCLAQNDDTLNSAPADQREPGGDGNAELKTLREGSQLVDEIGVFRTSGDRAYFETVDGKQRFTALENLNLERIMRMVNESTSPLVWNVSGGVTEYHGGNFLLVSRAFRRLTPIESGIAPSLTSAARGEAGP